MTLKPLKIIYQLVVGEYDEDGNLINEHPQPPATLYAPKFGELAARVAATMAAAPDDRGTDARELGPTTGQDEIGRD